MHVDVIPATADDFERCINIFELYLYDFSPLDESRIGEDGRYGAREHLRSYWEEPTRYPFLIRVEDRLAGICLVKKGSALAGDLDAMDLAEFFVLRSYRRLGAGQTAARRIFESFTGRWLVRVLSNNLAALDFWNTVIARYTNGRYTREQRDDPPRNWVIFRFAHS